MIADIQKGIPGWDDFIDFAGLDQIYVSSVRSKKIRMPSASISSNWDRNGEKIRIMPFLIYCMKKKMTSG